MIHASLHHHDRHTWHAGVGSSSRARRWHPSPEILKSCLLETTTQKSRSSFAPMEAQARLSELAFDPADDPQWITTGWPSLLGRWRYGHVSIVIVDSDTEFVVVLGGYKSQVGATDSVVVLDTAKKQFIEGPRMNEKRQYFAAKECNSKVYVCGGYDRSKDFDTIEQIDVSDLLPATTSNTCKWKSLNCRLTCPRQGCTASVAMNRYIVVAGGYNNGQRLASVDILDTVNGNHPSVVAGIAMNHRRYLATSEVIGSRIYVVGGSDSPKSIEYLEFRCNDSSSDASTVFQANSSWIIDNELTFSVGRYQHAMAKVGRCLVVAGGTSCASSVEVLDIDRRVVWDLPNMKTGRSLFSMVALSSCLLVVSSKGVESLESLSLVTKREQLKSMYSCRSELDIVIQKLEDAIHLALIESKSAQILREGAEAEDLLPILKSLCSDAKFRSTEVIQQEVDELTSELEKAKSVKQRLLLVEKINVLNELLAQNGIMTDDSKPSARRMSTTYSIEGLVTDSFYLKLVEVTNDPIIVKLHELSGLVRNIYHMRVFQTFLNHLFRSGSITSVDQQRCISKALKTHNFSFTKDENGILEADVSIRDKQDAALKGDNKEEPKCRDILNDASQGTRCCEATICYHLAAMQFRIGHVDRPLIKTQTNNVDSSQGQKDPILSRVQALGWSLNQLYTSYGDGHREEAVIAAICSILNACSFGSLFSTLTPMESTEAGAKVVPSSMIGRIVDLGDVDHLASVVEQRPVLSVQQAFAEGIAMVDKAIAAAAEGDNSKIQGCVIDLAEPLDHTGEFPISGSGILVVVMGQLANALAKLSKTRGGLSCASNDEAVILALAVTAKLVQSSESKSDSVTFTDTRHTAFDPCKFASTSDKQQPLLAESPSMAELVHPVPFTTSRSNYRESFHRAISSDDRSITCCVQTNHSMTPLGRLERLEAVAGNFFPVVQRISALEQSYGLVDGEKMNIPDRLAQLEAAILGTAAILSSMSQTECTGEES